MVIDLDSTAFVSIRTKPGPDSCADNPTWFGITEGAFSRLMSIGNSKDGVNDFYVNEIFQGVVSTKIEFMSLTINEIINYSEIPEPYQCAGGFAIEGKGGMFIKKIDGCFSNVIGLSLPWLKTNLEKSGLSELFLRNKNYC